MYSRFCISSGFPSCTPPHPLHSPRDVHLDERISADGATISTSVRRISSPGLGSRMRIFRAAGGEAVKVVVEAEKAPVPDGRDVVGQVAVVEDFGHEADAGFVQGCQTILDPGCALRQMVADLSESAFAPLVTGEDGVYGRPCGDCWLKLRWDCLLWGDRYLTGVRR